jgi:hypothetical protein
MLSHITDAVLFAALVLTSLRVGTMYRELKRLRPLHEQHCAALDRATAALGTIRGAVGEINRDGARVLEALDARIAEGRRLVIELELRSVSMLRHRNDRQDKPAPIERAAA